MAIECDKAGRRRRRALLGAVAGLALAPAVAWAQSATDVETLVVTAAKRETKLLETPMSIVVVDHATLQATNADTFADVARLVPQLTYTDSGPGNKRYALRGLQSAGEPEVALYYDEIPISGLPGGSLDTGDSQPDIKLWDVDRVEVLLGPQGTLYGNGSMGGAIRIISKRPVLDSFEAA
ncbi:Plug domain-containing protein, partial [Phenylobacterium sp.]|uniref:Plug domain-containing protein n=1 Tax=Phenylobacterium sp. TaxID=1871053 RepID=UPI0025CD2CFC